MLPEICAQLIPRVFPNEYPGLSNGVALSGPQLLYLPTRGMGLETLEILSELMFWDPNFPPKTWPETYHLGLSFPSLGLLRTNRWCRHTLSVKQYGIGPQDGKEGCSLRS